MQRLALAVALTAAVLYCGSSTPAQAEILYPAVTACEPFPPWYPRGWELMMRRPCVLSYAYGPYAYGRYYGVPRYYPLSATYTYRPALGSGHPIHRRPYLRPGWWW
jgi:hypothetical protein